MKAARDAQLFERGWLPDFLPASAANIEISNDLDLNISSGSFDFDPRQYSDFSSRTETYRPVDNPFENYEGRVSKMLGQGYEPRTFADAGEIWVFFCHIRRGRCKYDMWPRSRR